MAQLYFKYGVMGSSKSANALMTHFNYEIKGQKALLVKPKTDTRTEGTIASRIGLSQKCIYFDDLANMAVQDIQKYACVIVDEAQFLTEAEINLLTSVVDDLNVPVICYGLKTDFKGHLFEGSRRLLEIADKIEELKTVCWCGKKAIMNARFDHTGKVLREGDQIVIGTDDQYVGLCRKHWVLGDIGPIKDNL